MNLACLNFVSAGQWEDEGWMQILVFVVMAVIWAIGGIMKARADKQKQQEKSQPVRPGQRPVQGRPAGRPQPVSSQKRPVTRPEPRPPQKRPAVRPTFDSIFAPDKIKQKIAEKILPQQKPVELKAKTAVTSPKPIDAAVQPEMFNVEDEKEKSEIVVAEGVLNFGEPEQLQAAIIHYEVLGKCLGLRQGEERIWV